MCDLITITTPQKKYWKRMVRFYLFTKSQQCFLVMLFSTFLQDYRAVFVKNPNKKN